MFDVHPIVVHFPIALLMLYAMVEICSPHLSKYGKAHVAIKLSFLFIGTVASWVALSTGEIAAETIGEGGLVGVHSFFAGATVWIFSLTAGAYFWSYIAKPFLTKRNFRLPLAITKAIDTLAGLILHRVFVVLLAVAGLLTLTTTGALGGAIVYGPEVDPIVSFVYHLFSPLF